MDGVSLLAKLLMSKDCQVRLLVLVASKDCYFLEVTFLACDLKTSPLDCLLGGGGY